MLKVDYEYISFGEIIQHVGTLSGASFQTLFLCLGACGVSLFLTFILIPLLEETLKTKRENREKEHKRRILQEILIKKEIEDEIEKEIQLQHSSPSS